ncbi:hypothetical protein KKA50_00990 [Patescibacteria group bacterium]|nr:hypothetical protein [Patescibacteria group bacterium]
MPNANYKVIVCEGGDQVGKADAILTFSEKMMDMDVPVTYASFPIYATPIGASIRLFLRNGLDDLNLPKIEELKVKMALYALNRLEFMDVLLSHSFYKKTLILLDRSPFSNAVTIAYGLTNMEEAKDAKIIDGLIDYALELDQLMIKKMKLDNCVVQMVSEDRSWDNVRNETADINENIEVQKASDQTYKMYAERVGAGWKQIITKKVDGWRDRGEIFDDIYEFLISRNGALEPKGKKMIRIRYEIGIEEILLNMYKGYTLPEGIVTRNLKALRSNDKDTMHNTACLIGVDVGKTCKIVRFRNKRVRNSAKKIIDEHPAIIQVIQHFINKDFADKFVKAINER